MRAAFAHELLQRWIQRVPRIRSIESLITVAPAHDQFRRLELGKFVLDRSQCEKTTPRQFTRIQVVAGFAKEQSKHLGAH